MKNRFCIFDLEINVRINIYFNKLLHRSSHKLELLIDFNRLKYSDHSPELNMSTSLYVCTRIKANLSGRLRNSPLRSLTPNSNKIEL